MFLHLGSNYMVRKDKIITILDLETAGSTQPARNLLNHIIKRNQVINVAEEGKEKSLIICDDENYFSPISSSTLLKRSMLKTDYEL